MINNAMQASRAALLVLNYNAIRFIGDCCASLLRQTYTNREIFLLDNDSHDGSVEYVARHFPHVRIIKNGANLGVGGGFNSGIRVAMEEGFDYIALFNPDIILAATWLEECVVAMQRHPQAGICASLSLEANGKCIDSAGGTIINLPAGVFGGFLGGVQVADLPAARRNEDFPVFFGLLTAMLVRRQAFERCGFLTESFFMYFEDIDFSWRVLLSGGEIWCAPRAMLHHVGHGTTKSRVIELKILSQTEGNLLATLWRNLGLGSLVWVLPWLVMIRLAGAVLYLFVSPRIAWGKIKAIWVALAAVLAGRHGAARAQAQALRVRRDAEIFEWNPQPLVSISMPFRLCRRWLLAVGSAYHKPRSA